ncbi:MAG: sialidase family protein, partial [Phycisphaerales bacterium]
MAVWQGGAHGLPLGDDQDILVAGSHDDGLTWSTPAPLNLDPFVDNVSDADPSVATNGAGTWVVVWQVDNSEVMAARSTDNGTTWAAPVSLGGRPMANFGAEVVASGSTWVVVWTGTGSQLNEYEVFFARSTDNGASWSPREALNTDAPVDTRYDLRARLATDSHGTWISVWEVTASGNTGAGVDIWSARSVDNAVTWSSPSPLRPNAADDLGHDREPVIAHVEGDDWIAAWSSTTPSAGAVGNDGDIVASRSTDGGETWSVPAAVNTDASVDVRPDRVPALAADSGDVVIAWTRDASPLGEPGLIAVSHSVDEGGTWTPPQPLSDDAPHPHQDRDPQVAIGGDTWIAAWSSGRVVTVRTTDSGEFWSRPEPIDPTANNATANDARVDLATDQNTTWVSVWASVSSPPLVSDVLFARSTDSAQTWGGTASLLGTFAGTAHVLSAAPRVATDQDGSWIVVWAYRSSLNGTEPDLLLVRSADDGQTWTDPTHLTAAAASDMGNDIDPAVASNGTGTWVISWASNKTSGGAPDTSYRIWATRSVDGGATWSEPKPIGSVAALDQSAPRTIAVGSTWVTVWTERSVLAGDYDIVFARSTDDGLTWSVPALVDPNATKDSGLDYFPDLAADGEGTWVTVWRSDDPLRGASGTDNDIL